MSDKLRNLIVRTLSGAVLLAIVVAAAYMGYWGFGTLMLLITVIGVWEFYKLVAAKGVEPQRGLGMLISTIYVLGCVISLGAWVNYVDNGKLDWAAKAVYEVGLVASFVVLVVGIALIFVREVFLAKKTPMLNIASTIMGIFYVAVPMSLMLTVPLMLSPLGWTPLVFLFYLFIVWGNDVFAYLVGITLGRHKMCERLSPKKSWEGFVGGVIGAMVMGAVGAVVVGGNLGVWLGLSVVVSLSSVVGDLVESMFKRDAGVKDSGNILPGHGGILDRFDALILSAPFAFIYLLVVVVVPNI